MRPIAITAAVTLAVLSTSVAAQDTEATAAEIEQTLRDPAMQDAVAGGVAAAAEAMLDVPLAPLARAAAEAAGEDPRDVDPDMTLRRTSPGAEDIPAKVRESLPRMMGAVAGMAGGVGAMMPALREMADRMREAVDRAASATVPAD
ncbi:hypothetical protein GRI40_07970 [Altererythrobacter aerius]|uniref:Uncharacterized protein n=1 Tax=Tsuneonella aeria TaxID=1837929 RepID=A0A6I4TGF5_9SPHN|nr:hypothetical protein [Tsuneonella aeria]MXO75150.1 hypothetical protein [Tsuneonella aeria]